DDPAGALGDPGQGRRQRPAVRVHADRAARRPQRDQGRGRGRPGRRARQGREGAMSRGNKMAIKDLNFNNTGSWPREYKLGFCVIVALVIVGLAWYLFIGDKKAQLADLEKK